MDWTVVIKAAFSTVGLIQLLKNVVTFKNKKLWIIPTVILSVVLSLPFIPDFVYTACLTLSSATLFYDTILKAFEKVFNKDSKTESEQ